ncbi:MAG: hypothetical protein P1P63_08010 [Treponemataceae bacterium]
MQNLPVIPANEIPSSRAPHRRCRFGRVFLSGLKVKGHLPFCQTMRAYPLRWFARDFRRW